MNIAILLSGGTGTRIESNVPKQYIKVNGRRIIDFSLEVLSESEEIDYIVVVAAKDWQDVIYNEMSEKVLSKTVGFVLPGANRQMSIFNALCFINEYFSEKKTGEDYVFVHDAARPNLTGDMIKRYLDGVSGHDGLIPVLPMKDTVYISEDGKKISGMTKRSTLFAGQAPEVFLFDKYFAANNAIVPDGIMSINGSTEPALMAGMDIVMIPGEERNVKITTQSDLEQFIKDNTL